MKVLAFLLLLPFLTHSMEIIEGERPSIAQVIEVHGEVYSLEGKTRWSPVENGQRFPEGFALKTLEKGYAKILLKDNSIIKISEQTAFQVNKDGASSFEVKLGRGKLRMLSYQNSKTIKTPWGDSVLNQGEFLWNVFNDSGKL
ncbi:MAG: FecR domain-containing protein, partial [Halobacteriovoraceae bacterium]|nr:FecR domain-containing protein [Halobacteriovoraceae bacterium]